MSKENDDDLYFTCKMWVPWCCSNRSIVNPAGVRLDAAKIYRNNPAILYE